LSVAPMWAEDTSTLQDKVS